MLTGPIQQLLPSSRQTPCPAILCFEPFFRFEYFCGLRSRHTNLSWDADGSNRVSERDLSLKDRHCKVVTFVLFQRQKKFPRCFDIWMR